ncbi:MAG: helix-turn-helix transcriptional regulator [Candidatus Competibacteraceae bacterium]
MSPALVPFIPTRLQAARKAAGLTQQQVAARTGLAQAYISALEQGLIHSVEETVIVRLAEVLGVAMKDLQAVMVPAGQPMVALGLDPSRLRAARTAAGLTQKALAERTGLDQSRISRLEKGRVGCDVASLQALANALNVSINYLLKAPVVAETGGHYETDPRLALVQRYDTPAGLRELATAITLLEELRMTPEEWRALAALAANWRDGELVPREGWVQILFSLRSATMMCGGNLAEFGHRRRYG